MDPFFEKILKENTLKNDFLRNGKEYKGIKFNFLKPLKRLIIFLKRKR